MRDVLRQWRENYYVSRLLSSFAKPVERSCNEISRRLRSHVARNGVRFQLPNGRTMELGRDCGIAYASALFWEGLSGFEAATSRTLQFIFSRSAAFVDVGANYGFYSLLAAHWNPNLQVIAFEPVPQIFECLKCNIRLNALAGRVEAYCVALSAASGPAKLYVPRSESPGWESTATLAQESWQHRQGAHALDVDAMSFEDFERLHPMRIDVVKIDVEDHEASVLLGMKEVLRRDRPFVVCEILQRAHGNERTREIIQSLGYTPYWITTAGYIRVSRFDFERRESQDFLLSPVSDEIEIVTNLETLWTKRQAVAPLEG